MITLYVLFVVSLLTLMVITQLRNKAATEGFRAIEMFEDKATAMDVIQQIAQMDPAAMRPSPEFFAMARSMLDKYDRPELWKMAKQGAVDPGEMARQHLGITN
jgi:hypothetical protein